MISPRVATNTKLLVIYDVPQHANWVEKGTVTYEGLGRLLTELKNIDISSDDVSVVTLTDVASPKSQDFKDKEEFVQDFIETVAPNIIVLPTAKSFEHAMSMKGASKFYNKVFYCEKYKCKAMAVPPYSMLVYNPEMKHTITSSFKTIKREMEFPELVEKEKVEKQFVNINTIEKFRSFFKFYAENVFSFAVDTETTSLQFNNGNIISIQFSHKPNFGAFISTPAYTGKWTEAEWTEIVAGVKYLIEDESREKLVANGYFDFKFFCHEYGISLPRHNVFDVLIASFLCDENREAHSLKFCASTLLDGFEAYDHPLEVFKDAYCKEHKIKKADFKYSYCPEELLLEYSCLDVDANFQLATYFKEQLKVEEQEEVFKDVSSYAWALARIEQNGWKVDVEEAARYKAELEERIGKLDEEIQGLTEIKVAIKGLSKIKLDKENLKRKTKLVALKEPLTFLCGSVDHKRYLFQHILRFPEIKKTKKGMYATDKECFTIWAEKYPHVKSLNLIKNLEELKKMLGTYISAILNRNVKGRLHCSFRVCGASTGRISASSPSLMNVTMHSEEAVKLKKCFTVEVGNKLVIADLSNAELRVTAAISKDPIMCEGFAKGLDPHSNTAKEVFNLPCEVHEVKEKYPEARQNGKTLGFSALYGAGYSTVAKRANISDSAAQEMLEAYFDRHSGVRNLFDENIRFAREHGYALAVNGRRRRVPHINSEDKGLRARAERQANNFLIQSVSSDALLQSVVRMLEEIDAKRLPYKIINVIHDSCEMECPSECVKEAYEFLTGHMARWPKWIPDASFPFLSDGEVGTTWADVDKFNPEKYEVLEYIDEEESEDEEEAA